MKEDQTLPAVYDAGGVQLLTGKQLKKIKELAEEIICTGEKMQKLITSTAEKYFAIGAILLEAEKKSTETMTAAKYADLTGLPERMISTAKKIYSRFYSKPEELKRLTLKNAVKLVGKDDAESSGDDGRQPTPIRIAAPTVQEGWPDCAEEFSLPTKSGANLDSYRLHADRKSGNIYLLHKGFGTAFPVASLTVEQPKSPLMESAYSNLMDSVQKDLEGYYAAVEQESYV